jgi:hypothetical protein
MALAVLAATVTPATLLFIAAYLLAALLIGVGFASSRRDACLLLAVVALPCIHLGWGSGFLAALARGAIGRRGRR